MAPPQPGEVPLFKGTFDCAYKTFKFEVYTLTVCTLVVKLINLYSVVQGCTASLMIDEFVQLLSCQY